VIGQQVEGADGIHLRTRERELARLGVGDRSLHVGEEQRDRGVGDSRERRPEHTHELHERPLGEQLRRLTEQLEHADVARRVHTLVDVLDRKPDGQAQLLDLLDGEAGGLGHLAHGEPFPGPEGKVAGDRREATGRGGFDHLLDAEPAIGEPLQEGQTVRGVRRARVVETPRLVLGGVHATGCYEPSRPIASANAAHHSL
jgi:hypothetical protein